MERYTLSRSSRQRVLDRAERLLRQKQQHPAATMEAADTVTHGNTQKTNDKQQLPVAMHAASHQFGPGGNSEPRIKPTSTTNTQTNESDFNSRTSSIGIQVPVTKHSIGAEKRLHRKSSSDSGVGSGGSKMCDESWILPNGHKFTPNRDQYLSPPSENSVKETSVTSETLPRSSSTESAQQKEDTNPSDDNSEKGEGHTVRDQDKEGRESEEDTGEAMESEDEDSLLLSEIDSLAEQSLQQAKLEKIRESVEARRQSIATSSIYQQEARRQSIATSSIYQQEARRLSIATSSIYQQPSYTMLPRRREPVPRSQIPVMQRHMGPVRQNLPILPVMNYSQEHQGWSQDDMAQLSYKLNHIEHAATLKGKLVTFYKNGDPHFKGVKVSISSKQFRKYETLLGWLDNKIYTPRGVKYIFLLPSGDEVKDLGDFINGRSYVVSSTKDIVRVSYGNSKEHFWSNRPPTAGKYRKADTSLALQDVRVRKARSYPASSRASSTTNSMAQLAPPARNIRQQDTVRTDYGMQGLHVINGSKPKVLTIISNTHRDSQEKVILNPRTTQTYEEILQDVSSMLRMEYPPVSALWTSRKPVKKVSSFSHLLRLLRQHDTYLATGQEGQPFESDQRQVNGVNGVPTDGQPAVKQPVNPKQRKPYNSFSHKPKAIVEASEDLPFEVVSSNGVDDSAPDSSTLTTEFANPSYIRHGPYQYPPRIPRHNRHLSPPPPPQQRYQLTTPSDDNTDIVPAYPHHKARGRQYPPQPRHQPPQAKQVPEPRLVTTTPPPDAEETRVSQRPAVPTNLPYRRPYEEKDCVKVHIHGFSRTFYAPRYGQHEPDGGKPHKKLKLDWVYGYRGRDSRNNLLVLPSGELLYFVATVVIMYDTVNNQQRHYREHKEDVTCIALHPEPSRPRVASGQTAGYSTENVAHIRIWDPMTLVTYAVVGAGFFTNAVTSIGFSTMTSGMELGSLLMAVDESDKHVLSVWDWQHDQLLATTHTSEDTVVWGQFHPLDHTTLVTYGKNHVFFWKLFWDAHTDSAGKLYRDKKSGLYEGDYMPKFVTSLAFSSSGDVITGDSNGRIVVWQSDHQDAYVYSQTLSEPMTSAHQKSVFSLHMLDDGTLISGGGNHVRLWDSLNGYRFIRDKELPSSHGTVRSVVPVKTGSLDGGLFVGTTQNSILSGNIHDNFRPIVQGHLSEGPDLCTLPRNDQFISCGSDSWVNLWAMGSHELVWAVQVEGPFNEMWALATHPEDYTFVNAGMDQRVRKWDALNHTVVWDIDVEKPCLSVDLDPSGGIVGLGTTSGRFIALSGQDGSHIFSMQAGSEKLGVLKFSPEGEYIAIGSHDCGIYIYEVQDEGHVFRRHGTAILRGHKNFVTHIDWSSNGKHIRSVSGDYDLLFWSVEEMKEVTAQSVRDEVWFSDTTVLSYNHLGAWSNLLEGEDINTADLAHKKDILAVGENKGSLKLYKYPCTAERPHYCEQKQYSGHVTKVAFSFDDHFLISSGGNDAAILQWSVVKNTHR